MEILMGYKALVQGGAPIELPPAGSYGDYCIRQHEFLSGLTPDSEPVREWTQFAENNRGSLPDFPCRWAITVCSAAPRSSPSSCWTSSRR